MKKYSKYFKKGLQNFVENFNSPDDVFVEDSIMWYCIDFEMNWYLDLNVHQKINFKQSFVDDADFFLIGRCNAHLKTISN